MRDTSNLRIAHVSFLAIVIMIITGLRHAKKPYVKVLRMRRNVVFFLLQFTTIPQKTFRILPCGAPWQYRLGCG